MNILLLTTYVDTGGITSYILTLGEALVNSGHKVWVASSGGDAVGQLEAVGIKHVRVNIRTKSEIHPKLVLSLFPLKSLIQQEKIDIIHAHTRVTQVLGALLSRLTAVKMVTTCHGFFRPRFSRRTFLCWGEAVIAISKPVVKHLRDDFKVPQGQIHLINNGLDLNRFKMTTQAMRQKVRQAWGVKDEFLIGIIARLSDVKGIDILLKAMPVVLKEIPRLKLMIVGQGPEEAHLKKITQELSLEDKVEFKNINNQPQDILPGFDLFVMPSLMEGLGLSVMEAQACGIPVVASRVGGLVDLIEEGKSGYLVGSADPQALANRIIEIYRNPQHAQKMATQARLNIENHFSSEIMLKKTLELYKKRFVIPAKAGIFNL